MSSSGNSNDKNREIIKEEEVKQKQESSWDEPTTHQLEELLKKDLLKMLHYAAQKICEMGHSMDVANQTILKNLITHGHQDIVSNVSETALSLLKREREYGISVNPLFSEMKDLVEYTILDTVLSIQELAPTVKAADAMRFLYMYDMNLRNACLMMSAFGFDFPTQAQTPDPQSQVNFPNQVKVTTSISSDKAAIQNQKRLFSDDPDRDIQSLLAYKEALEKEPQKLNDWVAFIVKDVATRLAQLKPELEMLKKAKILQEEQATLKDQFTRIKDKQLNADQNLQEALQREQDSMKKLQSGPAEKELLEQELENLRQCRAELPSQLENSKRRQNQVQALWKEEEKEKLQVLKHIENLRSEREEEDARAKAEEENLKQTAERDIQKYKEDIHNVEIVIAELRIEIDQSKNAALSVAAYVDNIACGIISTIPGKPFHKPSRKRLPVFEGNFGGDSGERNRECIICMLREQCVVFLPCAHQVVCRECSNLYEHHGKNECPCCRAPIQKRISVIYRAKQYSYF